MSSKPKSAVPRRVRASMQRTRSVDRQKAARDRAIVRLFKRFDTDGNGYLTRKEMKEFMKSLGLETDSHTVNQFLKSFDMSKDQQVTLKEFKTVLEKMNGKLEQKQETLRSIFDKFDTNNSGSIDRVEIKNLLKALGEKYDKKAIAKLMAQFDKDTDGEITFDEFERWVLFREHEEQERKLFYKIFDEFDTNNDGHLTAGELELFLAELGPRLNARERHKMAQDMDKKGVGASRQAFAEALQDLHRQRETYEETLSELFDECDVDGDGSIREGEMGMLLKKFSVRATPKNVKKAMKTYDLDGDGSLNYHEFRAMLNTLMQTE